MSERVKYKLNGEEVSAETFLALPSKMQQLLDGDPPGAPNPALWPMESVAAGVTVGQVPEALEHAKRHGYNLEFTKRGRAVFQSQQHQREVLRKLGPGYGNQQDYFA